MKTLRRITASLSTFIAFAVLLLLPARVAAAGSATIVITSSAASAQQNSKLTITVTVNTGSTATNGAMAKVTYDTTRLTLVPGTVSYAGSPFDGDAPEASQTDGALVFARYKSVPPGPSGSLRLATFEVRALANSGSATIGLDQDDSFVGDNSNAGKDMLNGHTAATVSFTPIPPVTVVTPSAGGSTKPVTTVAATKTNTVISPETTPVEIKPATSATPDPGPVSAASQPAKQNGPKNVAAITPQKVKPNYVVYGALALVGIAIITAAVGGGRFVLTRRETAAPVIPADTDLFSAVEPPEAAKEYPVAPPNIEPEPLADRQEQPEATVVEPTSPDVHDTPADKQ